MLGKWPVFIFALTAILTCSCRKTPTAAPQTATQGPQLPSKNSPKPTARAGLAYLVAAYEAEPTGERAVDVWTAFGDVDARLSELKREVARKVGGARAEAEIERIELQRVRDEQMTRFAKVQARIEKARAALNALIASLDSRDGVRNAASIVTQGLGRETGEWPQGWRGIQGRIQVP